MRDSKHSKFAEACHNEAVTLFGEDNITFKRDLQDVSSFAIKWVPDAQTVETKNDLLICFMTNKKDGIHLSFWKSEAYGQQEFDDTVRAFQVFAKDKGVGTGLEFKLIDAFEKNAEQKPPFAEERSFVASVDIDNMADETLATHAAYIMGCLKAAHIVKCARKETKAILQAEQAKPSQDNLN